MSYQYKRLGNPDDDHENHPLDQRQGSSSRPFYKELQNERAASPASEPDDSFLLEVPPTSIPRGNFSREARNVTGNFCSNETQPPQKKRRSRRERLDNVIQPYEFQWERSGPLDQYLERIYKFYEGKGLHCIILSGLLNLVTLIFIVSFTTFITSCLDHKKFKPHHKLGDAIISDCIYRMPIFSKMILVFFLLIILWQAAKMVYDARDLLEMFHFYTKVLGVPNEDMQSIEWAEVVKRMARLPSPVSRTGVVQPIDAYQVTQRIMRLDNYFIALINLEKLNLSYPTPSFLGGGAFGFSLTRGLEWSLTVCLADAFFDSRGRLHRGVLTREERAKWAGKFERKLQFMGLINLVFGPFVVLYTLCFVIFRYFEEFYKTPKSIGLRQYTVLAKWQVREFNELPHYLRHRLDNSCATAEEYLDQFPRIKTTMVKQFLSFILGTLAGACALLALIDSELVMHLEVIPGWSVFSCGATLGLILAGIRSPTPPSVDPQTLLANLLEQLHYMPALWQDRLHSEKVFQEISRMYNLKVIQLVQELFGLVLTPFLLIFVVPRSCFDIVDMFRECTTYLPAVGHVCSLAQLDLKRHGPNTSLPKNYQAQNGKLEKSLMTFKNHNPDWIPDDPASSIYLSRLASGAEGQLHESAMSQSSHMEEPVSSNPLNKPMTMKVLNMMLEQPQML